MSDLTLLPRRFNPVGSISTAIFALLASSSPAYEPVNDVPPDFKMPKPLPLEASVASLKTRPGLRAELVAAEPLVMDPINLDWGPDGKLWVVEMTDYPLGIDGKGTPGGRVRFLEDRNGDEKYDASTVFLEGLKYPTSVKAWRKGALIVACPEIIYAEDTDGDGQADLREVLYRGFKEGNQQHRVNGLVWGADGWLHLANGDSGGVIESVKTGEKLDLGSFDLAVRPDSGEMKRLTGRTQYGRVCDDLGNWFGCSNSRPIFHFFLNDEDLRRNPHAVYPPGAMDIDSVAESRRVFPLSQGGQRYNDPHAANRFTSACGLEIYRDHRLGEGFSGNAFICEPVHNLVSRRIIEPEGAGFRAVRAADELDSEFLASTDHWFRPTAVKTGPDGGLWVVDMHRYVIEHPEWIPEPWQKVLDLRAGHDRGRIYRVISDACEGSMIPERLAELDTVGLVDRLTSRSGWTRDTAQQLLMERQISPTDEAILEISAEDPSPVTLNHLCGIFGEGKVPSPVLFEALTGNSPDAQAVALRAFNAESVVPPVIDAVVDLAHRPPDAHTALAAAIALGQIGTTEAGAALAGLMVAHSSDPLFVAAAMSSVSPHLDMVSQAVAGAPPVAKRALLPNLLETAVALKRSDALVALLSVPPGEEASGFDVFSILLSVLDRRRIELSEFQDLSEGALRDAINRATQSIERSRALVSDPGATEISRISAIAMLGRMRGSRDGDVDRLLAVLDPASPPGLQQAAARRLIELGALGRAIDRWPKLSPSVQSLLVSGSLADRNQVAVLLTAIESGKLPVSAIDAASRDRLLTYPQSQLRQQAKALLGGATHPDRAAVMKAFASAAEKQGDPLKGRAHFEALCSACHQLGGIGRNLGADLSALADKSPATLFTAILDPNQAVEDKYLLYRIDLKTGEALAGMIASEAGESVRLLLLDGSTRDLLREEIAALNSTGRSAMPEGLEAALDPEKLADLIAFVRLSPP